ncbi:hypothetical protein COEREDRAFT_10032 [Coemansia reversa NRRL 1564]|uniref:Conserved oligomeric Golgi complex subunit 7 n=1 Tax=Coemansia reversa (strain ATCC 12441 / NRRL 1564) TaxID=763665 RepID=A0A2G5B6W5_COERN|nr:hypothetical protein COEREDRAFT_10032 [Coemansia reversa NRRL 1564]|eukprot:PIA14766.1 hypothetical protein COEREDRAFT_10032 [Coemansia reversa NRRL 1564]
MDIQLETFGAAEFDVKTWLNRQFEALAVDCADPKADGETSASTRAASNSDGAQRLATQLHFLATSAQQNSDRIKARFRHQVGHIARDISALGRLVSETRQQMDSLSEAASAQAASSSAVEQVVALGTARRRVEETAAAFDLLRSYTDLPQKIQKLMETGEHAQAWELVDSAMAQSANVTTKHSGLAGVGLDADDARKLRAQIQTAIAADLTEAIAAQDVKAATRASRVLAAHGCGDTVETEFLRQRSEAGTAQLWRVAAEHTDDDCSKVEAQLKSIVDLATADLALAEALEVQHSEVLLEELLASYVETVRPSVQQRVTQAQHNGSAEMLLEVYQALVTHYSELQQATSTGTLSVGGSTAPQRTCELPRSLQLLFGPLADSIGSLAKMEAVALCNGSLRRLQATELGHGRVEHFVRAASQAMVDVFRDIEQALLHVLAVVPPSKLNDAITTIAVLALDVDEFLGNALTEVARRGGISVGELTGHGGPSEAPLDSVAYQPLNNDDKSELVSEGLGVVLLSNLFDRLATESFTPAMQRWEGLGLALSQMGIGCADDNAAATTDGDPVQPLVLALMEAQPTVAAMDTLVDRLDLDSIPIGIARASAAAAQRARTACVGVFFLLTSTFEGPLRRLPDCPTWHEERPATSSMNIAIPQFSCSPSEDVVDIGEKMHVMLPELEQVEAMHAQYARCVAGLPTTVQPLSALMMSYLVNNGDSADPSASLLALLELALEAIQQRFVAQICCITPPLSRYGCQQLTADVEYIFSVATSLADPRDSGFEALRLKLISQDNNTQTGSPPDPKVWNKICELLLQHSEK